MAYFKNKNTGVTWHITNKDHVKRLKADSSYIEVTNTKLHQNDKTTHNKDVQASNIQKVEKNTDIDTVESEKYRIELEMMEWHELRQYASEKGINTKSMKRKQIEKELLDLGDENVTN